MSSQAPLRVQAAGQALVVRAARVEEIIDLRHVILRNGLPRDEAIFKGDELPTSRHFAAFRGDEAVACATFHRNEYEGRPALQLRGMATSSEFRGAGAGARVLEYAEAVVLHDFPGHVLWCNARTPALWFYERHGWRSVSEVFEIPTAGPHRRMTKYACTECLGDDAARPPQFLRGPADRQTLVDESHFRVTETACPTCGQIFLRVFAERIDFTAGDDPQQWIYYPLSPAELERCVTGGVVSEERIEALPSRRHLVVNHPKGGEKVAAWHVGRPHVAPHD